MGLFDFLKKQAYNNSLSSHGEYNNYTPDYEEDDYEAKLVRQVYNNLKQKVLIDSDFWEEHNLDFRCNLVLTSYDSLQLNYEIKSANKSIFSLTGEPIEVKANVYNAAGDLLCVEEEYIDDDELKGKRYSSYILLEAEDLRDASYIEIYAH